MFPLSKLFPGGSLRNKLYFWLDMISAYSRLFNRDIAIATSSIVLADEFVLELRNTNPNG